MTGPEVPRLPLPPAHLHFLGICGYAVSGLALCCREMGYLVTGADEDAYPPTTEVLARAGISVAPAHLPENLSRWGIPALVILGNQVQAGNRELAAAEERGLPVLSEADAYRLLAADRRRSVICGTHGKTTTSAMTAWMLEAAGKNPGFRLGAASLDFGCTARLGDPSPGSPFVFEGDEYTTSALDRSAKFLHWDPQLVTLLNLELDHPDLYPTIDDYLLPYRQLLQRMPRDGQLIFNADDQLAAGLAAEACCLTEGFGLQGGGWRAEPIKDLPGRVQRLVVTTPWGSKLEMGVAAQGPHNAANALAALATAVALGADPDLATQAAGSYQGVARRFQLLGSRAGVTVVDDYAHHPTKLRATIAGARQQFGPEVQLVMVHIPHTFSRTLALLPHYRGAFDGLDLLVLGPIEAARERQLAHTVSSAQVAELAAPVKVLMVETAAEAVAAVLAELRPPAVVVCSSVRGFGGVATLLLDQLGGGES